VFSDHHLVMLKLKLKLRKNSQSKGNNPFDVEKLKSRDVRERFETGLQNRFDLLEQILVDDMDINQ